MNTPESNPPPPRPRRTGLRRVLLVILVVEAGVIFLFRPLENWRGRGAWEQARRALESRGEKFAVKNFIPAPVPDKQNRMAHPFMKEHFAMGRMGAGGWFCTDHSFLERHFIIGSQEPFRIAALQALRREADARQPFSTLAEGLARTWTRDVVQLIRNDGVPLSAVIETLFRQAGLKLLIKKPNQPPFTTPISIYWKDVTILNLISALMQNYSLEVQLDSTTKVFHVVAGTPSLPAVLGQFDMMEDSLRQFDDAMRRPQAFSLNALNYDRPAESDADLYNLHDFANRLATRAKIHALLGHRQEVMKELQRLSQTMECAGAFKPPTLVSARTRTEIAGLYTDTVQELLAENLLAPADCAEIQQQFDGLDLLGQLRTALRVERAVRLEWMRRHAHDPGLIIEKSRQLRNRNLPGFSDDSPDTPDSFTRMHRKARDWMNKQDYVTRVFVWLAPPGWVDQSRARLARQMQWQIEVLDVLSRRVDSRRWRELEQKARAELGSAATPYNFLAQEVSEFNALELQVSAIRQVRCDEVYVACALERFHAAHGRYPEALDELVPQFAPRLPRDLFDGQPLRYRRVEPDSYLLYSIGWDSKDDQGRASRWEDETGDWAWLGVPRRKQ